jgi:hypothetical protein
MPDFISNLVSYLLGLINPFKPRFFISAASNRCRERVQRINRGTDLLMIRANVENFGWNQREPAPCEIHLTRICRNDWPIEKDVSRLRWTDVDSYDGIRIIRNGLIDVCSVDRSDKPVLVVESEKGKKGYGIYRDAGVYRFDLVTVCKGSSQGQATVTVSFDGINWENVHIVSVRSRAKWRHWAWDSLVFLVILGLTSVYIGLPAGKTNTGTNANSIDPVVDVAIGRPFETEATITVKNSGVVPLVDVAVNLRCFVLHKDETLPPVLFFEGFESIENKNSWWIIGRLNTGDIRIKDARESLARCLYNRQVLEKSATPYVFTGNIVAADIVYRREIDLKQYHASGIASLMKDERTGEPYVWPEPMSPYHRHLLETVTAPNYVSDSK